MYLSNLQNSKRFDIIDKFHDGHQNPIDNPEFEKQISPRELLLFFTFLSHLFPLPCGAGSTVPRYWFDSSVMPFS